VLPGSPSLGLSSEFWRLRWGLRGFFGGVVWVLRVCLSGFIGLGVAEVAWVLRVWGLEGLGVWDSGLEKRALAL
jgi:hypothetical protein